MNIDDLKNTIKSKINNPSDVDLVKEKLSNQKIQTKTQWMNENKVKHPIHWRKMRQISVNGCPFGMEGKWLCEYGVGQLAFLENRLRYLVDEENGTDQEWIIEAYDAQIRSIKYKMRKALKRL